MSDEQLEQPKKKRGRPPGKKAKRHDPDEAPIDGNPGCDRVFNKEPGFTYVLASDEDIPTIRYRGGEICQRDSEQARPFYDQRQNSGESDIKVKNLTLMKLKDEDYAKHQGQGLSAARSRSAALHKSATGAVGGGLSSINTNFEDGGYRRQVV